ncbi:MAG: hypothetical protein Q8N60_04245, partial [Candidatus Diapherotrites archaeon]|nr:hypothetical protein [Candidatus Diapherotrites archaeon]
MKKILFLALMLLLFSQLTFAEIKFDAERITQKRAPSVLYKYEVALLPLNPGDTIWVTVPLNNSQINVYGGGFGDRYSTETGDFFRVTGPSGVECYAGMERSGPFGAKQCGFTVSTYGLFTVRNSNDEAPPTSGDFDLYTPNHALRT